MPHGLATPCPDAPPIAIAKVCFIAPSLTGVPAVPLLPSSRPGSAKSLCFRQRLLLRINGWFFRVRGVYTHFFPMFFSTWNLSVRTRVLLQSNALLELPASYHYWVSRPTTSSVATASATTPRTYV